MRNNILLILIVALVSTACSTQKSALRTNNSDMTDLYSSPATAFVATVIDNAVDVQNIVGSATMKLTFGTQTMKVNASVHMRRDSVIRLQILLPVIGTEVARVEFTPGYLLLVDKFNKQYVRVAYDDVPFLAKNNVSFYSLQALFWNELVVPTSQHATVSDATLFVADIDSTAAFIPLSLTDGSTTYQWQAQRRDKTLSSALITHVGSTAGTTLLSWLYSDFTTVGGKRFPCSQEITLTLPLHGTPQRATVAIAMDGVKTTSDWETTTTISDKYRAVPLDAILSHLTNL